MAIRDFKTELKTNEGLLEVPLAIGDSILRVKFEKSLAFFYGSIESCCIVGEESIPARVTIPFVQPRFTLRLPRLLRRLNAGQDIEIWSKDTFRGNWHIDILLPRSAVPGRRLQIELRLQARFVGTKHERYWYGAPVEQVRFQFL